MFNASIDVDGSGKRKEVAAGIDGFMVFDLALIEPARQVTASIKLTQELCHYVQPKWK